MVCPNKEMCLMEKKYLESRIKTLKDDGNPISELLTIRLEKVNKRLEEIEKIFQETEKVLDETEIAISGNAK
ncbi:hypothetical protein AYK24_00360 [Thermoplasmatales archaeon SG8-52-4]|nr:MAG: hypothetical protein AYK24_00360 [Thermoplasmatales archaeon SG8-52-4]